MSFEKEIENILNAQPIKYYPNKENAQRVLRKRNAKLAGQISQLFEPRGEKPPILDETEYDKIYPDFTYLQPSKQSFTKQLLIAQRDADAQWYEAKIGQVKIDIFNKTVQAAEHRERFVIERTRRETDAISYAKGVLDGIKKGRQETAKEILGYFKECHPEDWENLEARFEAK